MTPAQYILFLCVTAWAAAVAVACALWLHRELALWRTRRRFRALEREALELTGDIEAYRLGYAHQEMRRCWARRGKNTGARA